ncbi:MAG: hypothetical protein A2X23_07620 [Chloroflexi bacterium GWC2_73_18]|nr:MAG: hypothetical protein A2X23_07620 [Chloroflexi bacterium GWC2_73_18]
MTRLAREHPPIAVELDPSGEPVAIRLHERREPVVVCNRWRIEDAWWRRPLVRDYYRVAGERLLALIYRDGIDGSWHLERLYD